MPKVNWDQFRDGDRVRVTFEGTWREDRMWAGQAAGCMATYGTLKDATSAELIERPFTPPAAGKLFRHSNGRLFLSLSDYRFSLIRQKNGTPVNGTYYTWAEPDAAFRDSIEVLDI